MSAVALISGTLFKAPEQKTSKAGNQYVAATLKAREGDGFQYWRLTAFNTDAQAELMRLGESDAVSLQGLLRAEVYTPDGAEPRVSLSMVVDQVLALRPKPKPRKEYKPKFASAPKNNRTQIIVDGLNDEVPW